MRRHGYEERRGEELAESIGTADLALSFLEHLDPSFIRLEQTVLLRALGEGAADLIRMVVLLVRSEVLEASDS